jgi:hypothetical protein
MRGGIDQAGNAALDASQIVKPRDAQLGPPNDPTRETVGIESGSRDTFCLGHGPAVRIFPNTNTSTPVCMPGIARRLFTYALCSCTDVTLDDGSTFGVSAFDSRDGPPKSPTANAGPCGGAMGINGTLNGAATFLAIYGSTIVAGGGVLKLPDTSAFAGDLKANATLEVTGLLSRVGRDLWLDSDIAESTSLVVARDVYLTPGHVDHRSSTGGPNALTRNFVVSPPCACGKDVQLDIAGIVTRARAENDNEPLNLPSGVLSGMLSMGSAPAVLQCGRFALTTLSIPTNTLTAIRGRLALFVDGDLRLDGHFATDFGSTAELDVFVSGNLVVSEPSQVGSKARPSALRFYVGGSGPITISDKTQYAAQLYAPNAPVLLVGPLSIGFYGSIFARSFEVQSLSYMYFDQSIVDASDDCSAPLPAQCERCSQCPAGLACMNGSCGACKTDADCCTPLACQSGKCLPLTLAPL